MGDYERTGLAHAGLALEGAWPGDLQNKHSTHTVTIMLPCQFTGTVTTLRVSRISHELSSTGRTFSRCPGGNGVGAPPPPYTPPGPLRLLRAPTLLRTGLLTNLTIFHLCTSIHKKTKVELPSPTKCSGRLCIPFAWRLPPPPWAIEFSGDGEE